MKCKRILSVLLVLVLMAGMIPSASAAETTSNVMLFDYTGYTTTLSSQLAVAYRPNGTGSSVTAYIKNLGWHYARYNNVPYHDDPIYCIEPNKNFGASTSGNKMDINVTVNGSGSSQGASTWYSMPESYRRAITLILVYSDQMWDDSYSVTTSYRDENPNVPLRIATQFLIYEIVTGVRNADTFEATGNGYEDGDVFYLAGEEISWFVPNYNALVASVQGAMKLPSFVGSSSSNAPTIDLAEDSVLTWLHDDNEVMSSFTFTGDSNVNFNAYGNDLCVEQIGTISSSKVYSCYRNVPSADSSTVALYYGPGTSYQSCVKLYTPSTDKLYGYFKLNAPVMTGDFSLVKNTEDGNNRSGWKFSLYADSSCTNLLSGSHVTDSNGRISISGLSPGVVYVKELGHQNSTINSLYTCSSTNPQKVTITEGQTSSVTFYNKLVLGNAKLIKNTNTGTNRSGWKIGVYTDKACTTHITDSPFTIGEDGTFTVTGLKPGTYYALEQPSNDPAWQCDMEVKTVTVVANQTASVTFNNTLLSGNAKLIKNTNTGTNRSGWKIGLYTDKGCTAHIPGSPFTIGENGTFTVTGLTPGTYYALEQPSDDPAWKCDTEVKTVTVVANETASVTFNNTLLSGNAKLIKNTNTGSNRGGWKIGLYTDKACTTHIPGSPFTIGEDGTFLVTGLLPGTYYALEQPGDDPAWECDTEVKTVTVAANQTVSVSFTNHLRSGEIHIHKKDQEGSPLAGAEFLLEWSEDGTVWEPVFYSETLQKGGCSSPDVTDGKLTSLEDGLISYTGLWPTLQYRLTETAAPEGYQLLADCAYEGELPIEQNLILEVTVVNMHTFEIPKTGAKSMILMPISALLCLGVCATLLIRRRRR